MSKTLTEEYFEHYRELVRDYGENTCVLMQIGSFYEIQGLEGDGNVFDVAKMLNIQVTKKNKSIVVVDKANPYMAGFPKPALAKYLPILLEAGWTVAIYDQDDAGGRIKRCLKGVYSASMPMLEAMEDTGAKDLVFVYVQGKKARGAIKFAGYSVVRVNTGTDDFVVEEAVFEKTSVDDMVDQLGSVMVKYEPGEIVLMHDDDDTSGLPQEYMRYLQSMQTPVQMMRAGKDWRDVSFCNEYLKNVYSEVEFGMLTPVEYLDMERCVLSVTAVVGVLEYIRRHDRKYLSKMSLPKMSGDDNHVFLQSNTLEQLNVIRAQKSLFDVLNKTRTTVGRRGLRALLCRPYCRAEDIQDRLQLSEQLGKGAEMGVLDSLLDGIMDIGCLHRRMSLGLVTPRQLYGVITSYEKVLGLNDGLARWNVDAKYLLTEGERQGVGAFLEECRGLFHVESLVEEPRQCFRRGRIGQVDEIYERVRTCEDSLEKIRCELDDKFTSRKEGDQWVKLGFLESEGYFFTVTKLRWAAIKGSVDGVSVKGNTASGVKLVTAKSKEISEELLNHSVLLEEKFKLHWVKVVDGLVRSYGHVFKGVIGFVERIDISASNVKCKTAYGYCCPVIDDTSPGAAYVTAKGMRHPIIERIKTDSEYIPNDVTLDNPNNGMILYALNSCGKSSLLRSVGVNVIMAQCGLYVACDELRLRPFRRIISQVDMSDNLWKGHSSFVSEMFGLRKIMQTADENTLVLSDELTKGTEVISATSIFSAAVLELMGRGTKFLFTTHLVGVAKLEEIRGCVGLQIFHLSVEFEEMEGGGTRIIFRRKLSPGPSSELYGLEVARSIGLDSKFMERSFRIRDILLEKSSRVISETRSRYNKGKILDKCEVCGYKPFRKTDIPLDTHHIREQCTADENNFTGHFHKNSKFNLVSLCKSCHKAVHAGQIQIQGFAESSSGRILEFSHS